MKKGQIITVLVIILIIVAGWLFAASGKKPAGRTDLLTVGIISPLSGEVATMGEGIKRSIGLALLQAEASNKKAVTVRYEDDQCDSKKAISAYQLLKQLDVKVFYIACSGSVLAVAPLAKQNGDLILTAYAGSSEIRKTGDEVIRFIPDALSVTDAIIKYVDPASGNISGSSTFALLYESQAYSVSVADEIKKKFTEQGKSILIEEQYASNAKSLKTQIVKIKSQNPDYLIFIPVSDQIAQIAFKEMKDLKLTSAIIGDVNVCDYSFSSKDFGLKSICFKAAFNNDESKRFEEEYLRVYSAPSQYAFYDAATYDIFHILNEIALNKNGAIENIEFLKKSLLQGVKGKISSYEFDSNGEVKGVRYLNVVER